jgi:CBS domain-containing protein
MPTLGELVKNKPIHILTKGKTVFEVVEYMAQNNIGAIPILEGDKLAGIFSERDLMIRCVSKKLDLEKTKIEQVMTKRVIIMESSDSYEACLQIMKQESIRHIPVID